MIMNKIQTLFQKKQKEILSIYFTAGYPELNDTTNIILQLQKAGIDMIEVGIPFSDPIADGPVIQASNAKALKNGMTLKILFSQLQSIKEQVNIPLVMMGYLNPIMQYGFEQFCIDCQKTGISGIIIPDLPFKDYIQSYKPIAEQYNLTFIMLITPETSEERIRLIDENTHGFIYMVSSAATTGTQHTFDGQKQAYFRKIDRMKLRNPRLIGFGISNKETLSAAYANAAGAIIGSKFITLLEKTKDPEKATKELLQTIHER